MRRPLLLLVLALGVLAGGLPGAALARERVEPPVVAELFTAQGCAGCPEADRYLAELGARKGVLALTFPVDYWDYEGWADTFAEPAFSDRQRAYAPRLKVREIYTPEIVIDGRKEASGLDRPAVEALVKGEAGTLADGPAVKLIRGGERVQVKPGRGPIPRSDVWLVRYDPAERSVKVKAGDNKGKTVVQRYVVRELTRLGLYTGGTKTYPVPKASAPGLNTVVLVQGVRGGRIRGVAQG
jgi:hypothetical protein